MENIYNVIYDEDKVTIAQTSLDTWHQVVKAHNVGFVLYVTTAKGFTFIPKQWISASK